MSSASADRRRLALALLLALSGVGDALGGLWAVFDWKGVSAFMAGSIPDWDAVGRAARRGVEDAALRQLWANLGTALVALGATQLVAAWWVRGGRAEGLALARLVGAALVLAGLLMAGPGGQVSSLGTEAARGALILGLAAWATSGGEITRDAPEGPKRRG